jgi:hypothetical protein
MGWSAIGWAKHGLAGYVLLWSLPGLVMSWTLLGMGWAAHLLAIAGLVWVLAGLVWPSLGHGLVMS